MVSGKVSAKRRDHPHYFLTGGYMRKPKEKLKPVYQSCNVKYPERVWELTPGGWSSRPATTADYISREEVALSLHAVVLV